MRHVRGLPLVVFVVRQSSMLVFGLVLLHIAAIFAAIQNGLNISAKMTLIFMILISLFVYLKRESQFYSVYIRYGITNGWEIAFSENKFSAVEILPSTVVSSHLIVLHFKQPQHLKQTLFILKDALVGDEYRKLMVQLRIVGLKSIK